MTSSRAPSFTGSSYVGTGGCGAEDPGRGSRLGNRKKTGGGPRIMSLSQARFPRSDKIIVFVFFAANAADGRPGRGDVARVDDRSFAATEFPLSAEKNSAREQLRRAETESETRPERSRTSLWVRSDAFKF